MDAPSPAELSFHVCVITAAAGYLVARGLRFSSLFLPGGEWAGHAPGLYPGWGTLVDLSDDQWRHFRSGLPALTVLFTGNACVSHILRTQFVKRKLRVRTFFYAAAGSLFVGYLHGACVLFVLAFATVGFVVAKVAAGAASGAVVIWACNIALLLSARYAQGFKFSDVHSKLAVMDSSRGIFRWDICFNLTILRMLSFALDSHRLACARRKLKGMRHEDDLSVAGAGAASRVSSPIVPPHQQQIAQTLTRDSDVLVYFAYLFYPPLYLAGPILTFQDFLTQLHHGPTLPIPQATSIAIDVQVLLYGARFLADWLCLELLCHFLFFNSIAKHRVGLRYRHLGLRYGSSEMAVTAFWVLCFMWLKFATVWRFFRLAALVDGFEPPENMRRCFANNYDIKGFWRNWHSSFNAWLVRYLYIPLGGNRHRCLVIWPVFLFVAVWHDIEWRLLAWAILICVAFMLEMLAKQTMHALVARLKPSVVRIMAASGTACILLALMAANLLGFVLGTDGLQDITPLLYDWQVLVCSFLTFFSAANLNFYIHGVGQRSSHVGQVAHGITAQPAT